MMHFFQAKSLACWLSFRVLSLSLCVQAAEQPNQSLSDRSVKTDPDSFRKAVVLPIIPLSSSAAVCPASSLLRSTTRSGRRRSRRRSSATTTASGWRWWRTGCWTSLSCTETTGSPSAGTGTCWSGRTCSTPQVPGSSRTLCGNEPDVRFWSESVVSFRRDSLRRRIHQPQFLRRHPEQRRGWKPEQVFNTPSRRSRADTDTKIRYLYRYYRYFSTV